MPASDNYKPDQVNLAYKMAFEKSKKDDLSQLELAEVLVNNGVPNDLAKEIAFNIETDKKLKLKAKAKKRILYGSILLGIAILGGILSLIFSESKLIFIASGFVVTGLGFLVAGVWELVDN